LNDAQLLDCYDACQDGRCMASKVNSANNCYNTVLRRKAVANSSIVVGYLQSGIYYACIRLCCDDEVDGGACIRLDIILSSNALM